MDVNLRFDARPLHLPSPGCRRHGRPAAVGAAAAATAAAGDMSGEALWRVVDEVAENLGTLSEADAEALRGPAEKIQRLRDLHSSCMPHERQLRATHLALLTDHYLCSDKLLQLRRYCSVHLQDPALPEADRRFLLSLQQLTASLDKPSADAPQSA